MAADWNMILLEPGEIATGELEAIRGDFARFFLLRDPGAAMAVFTRRAKSGACEVYFSPGCAIYTEFIFERHPAQFCRAPVLLGTTLLVGHHASVGRLLGKPRAIVSFKAMSQQNRATDYNIVQPAFLQLKTAG
jgi:hypothetical protein